MSKKTGRPRGRPSKDRTRAGCQASMDASAEIGASYILDVLNGDRKGEWPKIDLAKFSVDHAIGKAKQKLEIPAGGNQFYFQLILMAQKEGEPPKIEASQVVEGKLISQPEEKVELAALSMPTGVDGDT